MAAIRRNIHINAAPRAVWRTLTTSEGWTSWYADEARMDGRKGGRVVLVSEDDEGNPVEEVGTVLTWRPTSRLEISWDSNSPAPTRGTMLTFSIARDGGETRVALVHSGGGPLDDEEARSQLDTTWRQSLNALRDVLEA